MSKTIKVVAIIIITFCIYLIGYIQGENNVMNNQIITKNQEKGFYTSTYNGKSIMYWYE